MIWFGANFQLTVEAWKRKKKSTDSSRQNIVDLLSKLLTRVLHQQFISHWIFSTPQLFSSVELYCRVWGCQPSWRPGQSSSRIFLPLPFPTQRSTGTNALQGNKGYYCFDAYILQLSGAGATWKQRCFISGSYGACRFSVLLSRLICFKDAGWNRRSRQSWEILDSILTPVRRQIIPV